MNDSTARRVLVLGGSGFIGRYAVAALLDGGVDVVVGTRRPGRPSGRLPTTADGCEQRQVAFETLLDPADWSRLIGDVDAVLNCVGILRQKRSATYDRVHHRAPAALAEACRASQRRFVHVSALSLPIDAGSRFLTSKRRGEKAIRSVGGDWMIARPSLLEGPDGFGARWLRGIARLPAFFAPTAATGRIAALDIRDLGDALAILATAPTSTLNFTASREFDLGGDVALPFADYIRALRRRHTAHRALAIPVPSFAARGFAHFCDL
ncbi:MAG: NAD-dependent epimerase/dehydratase family protein, partial [Pseudomonadota bacterium]